MIKIATYTSMKIDEFQRFYYCKPKATQYRVIAWLFISFFKTCRFSMPQALPLHCLHLLQAVSSERRKDEEAPKRQAREAVPSRDHEGKL